MEQIHATCIEINGTGILLRGPSGAGKSDFALRLIDDGAVLVADDRVDLVAESEKLIASSPANIRGLLEVYGIGIVRQPSLERTTVGLVMDMVPARQVERLPSRQYVALCGVTVPCWRINPFQDTAAIRMRLILSGQAGVENLEIPYPGR